MDNKARKDDIVEAMLPCVPFEGWSMAGARRAAQECGQSAAMARAVFPGGTTAILSHFAAWADERMMMRLEGTDPAALRVRDRIRTAVMARFAVLQPWREAERRALACWAVPGRGAAGARVLWRTADTIWNWAGDTARDYNRYTKRGLLCGVIGSATLAFLGDDSEDMSVTGAFLDRRIDNVLQLGRLRGRTGNAPRFFVRDRRP